jgi:hypothetical protein
VQFVCPNSLAFAPAKRISPFAVAEFHHDLIETLYSQAFPAGHCGQTEYYYAEIVKTLH